MLKKSSNQKNRALKSESYVLSDFEYKPAVNRMSVHLLSSLRHFFFYGKMKAWTKVNI